MPAAPLGRAAVRRANPNPNPNPNSNPNPNPNLSSNPNPNPNPSHHPHPNQVRRANSADRRVRPITNTPYAMTVDLSPGTVRRASAQARPHAAAEASDGDESSAPSSTYSTLERVRADDTGVYTV